MKIAIYARVSGRAQALKGTSTKDQEKACRAWAKENGAKVARVYVDAGVSGTLIDRPELARLVLDARSQLFESVVVYDLDRLARDLVVQETIVGELSNAGVELHSVNQPNLEGDDPSRVFARQIFGAAAQLHKAMTVLRLSAGRNASKERLGYCEGQPRFGFRREKGGTIAPHPSEQEAVDVIRRLRGGSHPASYRAICDELERKGLRPRRGRRWYPNTVRRIYARGNAPF